MKYSEKKTNSLKEGEGVRLLNFDGGREVPLSSFEGSPGDPLLNLKVVPGPTFKVWVGSQGPEVPGPVVLVPLLHHAGFKLHPVSLKPGYHIQCI